MLRESRTRSKLVAGAATLAVATALTLAPAAMQVGPFDDAAYAQGKSGDKGNKGGGNKGGGNKGGKSADKGGKDGDSKNSGKAFSETKVGKAWGKLLGKPEKKTVSLEQDQPSKGKSKKNLADGELHPSEKGRWNAEPAQAALDAHIKNGNFHSTVGMLAGYQVVLKSQSGETLTTEEQAALDGFLEEFGYELQDAPDEMDVSEWLNETYGDPTIDAEFTYTAATADMESSVSCSGADCPDQNTLDGLALDADGYKTTETENVEAENAEALAGLTSDWEDYMLANSNKDMTDKEDPLFDGISDYLGFDRPEPVEEPMDGDDGMDTAMVTE